MHTNSNANKKLNSTPDHTKPSRKRPHIVHNAPQAINLTQDHIERHNALYGADGIVGVPFGIAPVDRVAKPTRPGQLVAFIGRPANGKTFLMQVGFQKAMERLMRLNITNKNCVWISYEESLEDFVAGLLAYNTGHSMSDILEGSIKLKQIGDHAIIKVATLPFIFIGHSDEKDEQGKTPRPKMTMNILVDALDYVRYGYHDPTTDTTCEIELIVLDYLQRMHKENSSTHKVAHFEDCVDWCKDTAKWGKCPLWLGVQASRTVDSMKIKLPSWEHAQYTSNVEQTGDVIVSSWMPKNNRYEFDGQLVPPFGGLPEIAITDNLMYFKLLKQKKSKAPMEFALHVQPELLKVTEYKTRELSY